jgi:hypothetical protein
MGTGVISAREKRVVSKVDHSHPVSAEVKKALTYITTPPYVFMA